MVELLVVLVIIATGAAVVSLALRSPTRDRLEREAHRLAALLEMGRAESRATGWPMVWLPLRGDDGVLRFRFVGASQKVDGGSLRDNRLETPGLQLQLIAAGSEVGSLRLGPEAILPPQRVRLRLEDAEVDVVSDGIDAFAVRDPGEAQTAGLAQPASP